MDIKTTVLAALAHHQAGRLAEAERLYRSVAGGKPGIGNDARFYADAVHNTGLIAAATGRMDEALELLDRSIEFSPRNLNFRKNQTAILVNAARPGDAERAYRAAKRAMEFAPADSTILEMFAIASSRASHSLDAAHAWQRIAQIRPDDATVRFNIGTSWQQANHATEAINAYREAIRLRPGYVEAMSNLAALLGLREDKSDAWQLIQQLQRAGPLADGLKPLYGYLLVFHGRPAEGFALLDEVERSHEEGTVQLFNGFDDKNWMRYLAAAKADAGELNHAAAWYLRFAEARPEDSTVWPNLLSTSQYVYPDDPAALLELSRRFERDVGAKAVPLPPIAMRPLDGRRLRVGYVSADFRIHSAGFFIEPLLLNHDSSRIELHCFSSTGVVDVISGRLKAKADGWHDVQALTDDELAARVRAMKIDVLVDVSGHTGGSRLSMFALRPAPVQLTYLGYSSTTGLAAIDGLITDPVADPPGESDTHFTERLLRLPHVFAVFRPPPGMPEVSPPPFAKNGRVTLGTVAARKKMNDAVLDAWAAGMRAVPDSHLMLIGKGNDDEAIRGPLVERFAARGIDSTRLTFIGWVSFGRYCELHGSIDLMLDTFPFSGHTTTVQNLWLGVPVVTLAGRSHRARMGASVLTSLGLTELIAHTEADYGPLIARWANDPEGLMALRAGMRNRMKASPLMDEVGFARDFEALMIRAFETKLATGHV